MKTNIIPPRDIYIGLPYEELREYYLSNIIELIKNTCSEIIYDVYPIYKQQNLAFEPIDNKERLAFLEYRNAMRKFCHSCEQEVKLKKLPKEEMIAILDDLYENHLRGHHYQSMLLNIGFHNFNFVEFSDEYIKKTTSK